MAIGDKFKTNNGLAISENFITEQYWTENVLGEEYFINGTLWSWGFGSSGQLGTSILLPRSSPVQVGSLTNWKQVSCGGKYTGAIKTDGTLWSWGHNLNGSLGLEDLIFRSSPVQVGTLTDWKSVSCGYRHFVAVKTDGTLWTWGYNLNGQLGLEDRVDRSSPVQVGTLTNWKQVSSGGNHSLSIKTDGTLWSWGYNNYGQLGLGNTFNRSSPTQVGSLTNWKSVDCSAVPATSTAAAVKVDGTLWSWGRNNFGQLGTNNTTNYSSPVQVGSLTNWKSVSAGSDHVAAIK